MKGGSSRDQADAIDDALEVELGYEDFSPMMDDGEFYVEEGEEVLILKVTEDQEAEK
jgi:hypothetical protein